MFPLPVSLYLHLPRLPRQPKTLGKRVTLRLLRLVVVELAVKVAQHKCHSREERVAKRVSIRKAREQRMGLPPKDLLLPLNLHLQQLWRQTLNW
jgi:hypothetical protein